MKYLGIISILIGIYVNLALFTQLFGMIFDTIIPVFLIALSGIGLAILSLKENKGTFHTCFASVGLLVNLLPITSYLYLWIGIG
ncbi:hypothetical protein P7H50_05930 [Enterococcus durans]|uniref:hypothetical protein n=1 Tax=Enterococcus durans TaxID=53345 RepID=UPI0028903CE6|nr:hypothetical protein [Enterococcus durans]MDT2836427.1 hypothetical protein [Enterococcus durans]